jgi:putative addiction module killer protein
MTIEILEYLDNRGHSPYGQWFNTLNARAAAKVTAAIDRIGRGLMTNIESVGGGVYERKINFGPGYRIYFSSEIGGRVATIVILLNGGTKKSQSKDIVLARQYWKDYKHRKRRGEK